MQWWLLLQGFLPESADRFATDIIYPAFSPQMGIFFVCSTAYGVWKVCVLAAVARTDCIQMSVGVMLEMMWAVSLHTLRRRDLGRGESKRIRWRWHVSYWQR